MSRYPDWRRSDFKVPGFDSQQADSHYARVKNPHNVEMPSSPKEWQVDSWRSRGSLNRREGGNSSNSISPTQKPNRIVQKRKEDSPTKGPAAPLEPLVISEDSHLPHPATYPGSDNWALTPNGSLPSLPGTPSKAMSMLGWHRQGTPGSDHPASARSLLNRRLEEAHGLDGRKSSSSPRTSQHQSPKAANTSTAINSSPFNDLTGTAAGSISGVLSASQNEDNTEFRLRRHDSVASLASSAQHSIGNHPLTYSRRPSLNFPQSPAQSVFSQVSGASGTNARPPYRVYRPPHLRTDSTHALKPKMAHYDRMSANLRGQSRSPAPSQTDTASRAVSSAASQASMTPSEALSTSPSVGKRRLPRLGSFSATAEHAPNTIYNLDSTSLITKLANAKLDLGSRASDSPRGDSYENDGAHSEAFTDDVDLTADDMMMSGILTDEYCHSRTGSISGANLAVDIFEIGDRLGPGMMHDGYEITIAQTSDGFNDQDADQTGTQLEVIDKLGEGSYAVVYLVKEVQRRERGYTGDKTIANMSNSISEDVDQTVLQDNEDIFGTTLKADSSGQIVEVGKKEVEGDGRLFALKCLCKRDLSDAMLEVQRLESTIHQSIPAHPNIVTLYRTYETPEWLFLILEYCPGQDLFYWLEQAQDTENLGAATPGGVDDASLDLPSDSTPPSPGLLATTETPFLLSHRRLRLISRMFQQICDAVAFCHARGIAHRDIKPENFIVEDNRTPDGGTSGVKVKLTDFGLAVAQLHCIDFDCGSKPYMSYECRNNTTSWYDPIQSDVWSLGIVLLNLIFHRNPFSEPNAERCPSFANYVEDPILFLMTAFRGLRRDAAVFLAENVFCDVTEGEEGHQRHRISAVQFSEWANNLEDHLERPNTHVNGTLTEQGIFLPESDPGPNLGLTSPLWHSRSPASSVVTSLMSSPIPAPRSINIHQELASVSGLSETDVDNFQSLFPDSSQHESEKDTSFNNLHGTGLTQKVTTPSIQDADNEWSRTFNSGSREQVKDNMRGPSTAYVGGSRLHTHESVEEGRHMEFNQNSSSNMLEGWQASNMNAGKGHNQEFDEQTHKSEQSNPTSSKEVDPGNEDEQFHDYDGDVKSSFATNIANPKRRKRGARKAKTLMKQQLKRSHQIENEASAEEISNIDSAHEASPALAKEINADGRSLGRDSNMSFVQRPNLSLPSSLTFGKKRNEGHLVIAKDARSQSDTRQTSPENTFNYRKPESSGFEAKSDAPTSVNSGSNQRLPFSTNRTRSHHPASSVPDWREKYFAPIDSSSLSAVPIVHEGGDSSREAFSHVPTAMLRKHRPSPTANPPFKALSTSVGSRNSHGISMTGTRSNLLPESSLGTINERTGSGHGFSKSAWAGGVLDHNQATSSSYRPQRSHHPVRTSERAAMGIKGGALANVRTIVSSNSNSMPAAAPRNSEGNASARRTIADAPRKTLGQFLQDVKKYNKSVKSAPGDSEPTDV